MNHIINNFQKLSDDFEEVSKKFNIPILIDDTHLLKAHDKISSNVIEQIKKFNFNGKKIFFIRNNINYLSTFITNKENSCLILKDKISYFDSQFKKILTINKYNDKNKRYLSISNTLIEELLPNIFDIKTKIDKGYLKGIDLLYSNENQSFNRFDFQQSNLIHDNNKSNKISRIKFDANSNTIVVQFHNFNISQMVFDSKLNIKNYLLDKNLSLKLNIYEESYDIDNYKHIIPQLKIKLKEPLDLYSLVNDERIFFLNEKNIEKQILQIKLITEKRKNLLNLNLKEHFYFIEEEIEKIKSYNISKKDDSLFYDYSKKIIDDNLHREYNDGYFESNLKKIYKDTLTALKIALLEKNGTFNALNEKTITIVNNLHSTFSALESELNSLTSNINKKLKNN